MFDLDEDFYDENKIEGIELNCPWTITVPSGASHDFMITKLRWSFEHPFWLTANLYTIDNPAKPIVFDIKTEALAFAKIFITDCLQEVSSTASHSTRRSHSTRTNGHCRNSHGDSHRLLHTRNKEDHTESIQLKVVISGGARTKSFCTSGASDVH